MDPTSKASETIFKTMTPPFSDDCLSPRLLNVHLKRTSWQYAFNELIILTISVRYDNKSTPSVYPIMNWSYDTRKNSIQGLNFPDDEKYRV
jgi:hypothetical protein